MPGLIISRKREESFEIWGPCKITVIAFKEDKVRLMIEAEDEVGIWRSELITEELRNAQTNTGI